MADAELNPEEFPEVPAEDHAAPAPSALEVLDRIEAEKAAETAGPGEETVTVVNEVDASQPSPEKAADPEPEKAVNPKAKRAAELEDKQALVRNAKARCEEIDVEIKALEKSIKELNKERVKLVQLIKHNREVTRPSLHELNKQQAVITAAERDRRYAALDVMERLGPHLQRPRNYPPKFKLNR